MKSLLAFAPATVRGCGHWGQVIDSNLWRGYSLPLDSMPGPEGVSFGED
jgi:hypothetical protein